MDSVIEIKDLVVEFPVKKGVVRALNGLDLTVGRGQVFGFIGPNGAGKTTTMHVLLGFIKAVSGEARVLGEDVRHSIARQQIGFLPEHPDTYRFLTGRELLTMAGRLFLMSGKQLKARIDELVELVGLTDSVDRRTATYSRGMLQRIGLAQALVHDPDLVILDEPSSGFDPLGRISIRNFSDPGRSEGAGKGTGDFGPGKLLAVRRVEQDAASSSPLSVSTMRRRRTIKHERWFSCT